jgi:ATP-binding cassette subfamily D (ALD) protein 3
MSNLDSRIANADQLLTTDVDKFCDTVTDLYSNISKPLLDIVIYVYRLTTQLGGKVKNEYFGSRNVIIRNRNVNDMLK